MPVVLEDKLTALEKKYNVAAPVGDDTKLSALERKYGLQWGKPRSPEEVQQILPTTPQSFAPALAEFGLPAVADDIGLLYAAMETKQGRGHLLPPEIKTKFAEATGWLDNKKMGFGQQLKGAFRGGALTTQKVAMETGILALQLPTAASLSSSARAKITAQRMSAGGLPLREQKLELVGAPPAEVRGTSGLPPLGLKGIAAYTVGIKKAVEETRQANPQLYARQRREGAVEAITHPADLVLDAAETLPYMGAALVAPGGKFGRLTTLAAFGKAEMTDAMINAGAEPEVALAIGTLLAPIHAAIENAQINTIAKGIPGVARLKELLAQKIGSKVTQFVSQNTGKVIFKESIENLITQGAQESLQDGMGYIAGQVTTGKKIDIAALTQQISESFVRGAGVGAILGGANTAAQLGLLGVQRAGAGLSLRQSQQRQALVGRMTELMRQGVPEEQALAFVLRTSPSFAPGFAAIPGQPPSEVPPEAPVSPRIEAKPEMAPQGQPAPEVVPATQPAAEKPLTRKEKIPTFEQFAKDIGVRWEELSGPNKNLETLAQTRIAYDTQYGKEIKPGAPISEQIQLTPAQRTRIAMVAREQGAAAARELSNKLLAARVKQLGREYYNKPIADIEGLIRYARQHEAAALSKTERESFRGGQIDVQTSHRELIYFAKTYLPTSEQGKILPALGNARTPGQVRAAAQAINRVIKNYDLRLALEDFKKAKKGIDLSKLPEPQRQQFEELMATFTETVPSGKLLARMHSALEAAGDPEELGIPQSLINRANSVLAHAQQTPLRKLAPDDIRVITATIQAIAHAAETKTRLKYNRKYENAQEAMDSATADVLNLNPPIKKGGREIATEGGKPGQWIRREILDPLTRLLTIEIFTPGYWTNKIAGDKGAAYDILERSPREAEKQTKRIVHSVQDYLNIRLQQEAGIDFTNWKTVASWSDKVAREESTFAERIADKAKGIRTRAELITVTLPTTRSATTNLRVPTIELTKAELAGLYLTIGDMQTRAQLLHAGQKGVTFYEGGPAIKFTEDDLWALADQIPRDVKKAADIFQETQYEYMSRDIAPVWLDDHGFSMRLQRDHWGRLRDSEWREFEPSKAAGFWRQRHLDNMSIFKPRSYADEPFVIRDMFSQFARELSMASQYAGKQLAYQDAMRLLNDQPFRRAVKSRFSPRKGQAILEFLEDEINAFQGLDATQQTPWAKAINRFTGKATVGLLTFNPPTPIIMPISSLNFLVYTDLKNIEGALGIPFGKEFREGLAKRSPILRDRFSDTGQFLFSPGMSGDSITSLFGAKRPSLAQKGMDLLHHMDTWGIENGAKLFWSEGQTKGLKDEALWDFVVAKAEEATDLSQAGQTTMTTTGLARIARKHPTLHLGMLFTAETQKIFGIPFREYDNYKHSAKTGADKARFTKALVIPIILGQALVLAVREGVGYLTGGGPPPEKPKEADDRIWDYAKAILGMYPLAGKRLVGFAEMVQTAIQEKNILFARTGQDPLQEAFVSTGRATAYFIKTGQEIVKGTVLQSGPHKGKSAWIYTLDKGTTELTRASGLLGLPVYNPYRIGRRMIIGESQAIKDYEIKRAINTLADTEEIKPDRMKQIVARLKQENVSLSDAEDRLRQTWEDQDRDTKGKAYKKALRRLQDTWRY